MKEFRNFIITSSGKKFEICLNSVWDFPKIDSEYGNSSYSARIPGEVYLHFFFYFTRPRDVILDLFCGSGTGIDMGNDFNRIVLGFDLTPFRKDITKFDVLEDRNPFFNNVIDHIFLDPPYYDMNKGKYTKKPSDLSNLNYNDFFLALETIIKKFYRSLKLEGYIGIILSNKRSKGNLLDIEQDTNTLFSEYFTLKHKIIVPYYNTYDQSYDRAKLWSQKNFLLIGHRTLFIFQKV